MVGRISHLDSYAGGRNFVTIWLRNGGHVGVHVKFVVFW